MVSPRLWCRSELIDNEGAGGDRDSDRIPCVPVPVNLIMRPLSRTLTLQASRGMSALVEPDPTIWVSTVRTNRCSKIAPYGDRCAVLGVGPDRPYGRKNADLQRPFVVQRIDDAGLGHRLAPGRERPIVRRHRHRGEVLQHQ